MATREIKTGNADALDAMLMQFYEAVLAPEALRPGPARSGHPAGSRALVNRLAKWTVVQCADYFNRGYIDRGELYQDRLNQNSLRYSAGGCASGDDSTGRIRVLKRLRAGLSTVMQQPFIVFPHLFGLLDAAHRRLALFIANVAQICRAAALESPCQISCGMGWGGNTMRCVTVVSLPGSVREGYRMIDRERVCGSLRWATFFRIGFRNTSIQY